LNDRFSLHTHMERAKERFNKIRPFERRQT
jgi:hypothetical protein